MYVLLTAPARLRTHHHAQQPYTSCHCHIQATEGTADHTTASAAVAEAQADLRYIKWYPKTERYISMYADGTAKRPKKAEFMRFWALQNAADREYLTKQEAADAWVAAGHEALRGMQAESAPAPAPGAGKPSQSRAARQRTPKTTSASAAQVGDESGNDSDSARSSGSSSNSGDDEAPTAAAPTIRVRTKKPARTVEALPAQAEALLDDAFFAGLGTAEPDIAAADMEFMAEAAPGSSAGSEGEDEEEDDEGGRGRYRPREWKPGAFVKQREERQYKHAGRYRDSAAARRQTEDAEEADEYAPRRGAGGRQHQQFSDSGRPPASAGMKRGRDRAPAQFDRYQPAEARHAAARGASSKRAHMTFDAEEPSSHRAASRPARPSYGHRAPRDTSAAPRTTHFDNFQPPEARHAAARGPAAPRQHMTFD